MSQAIIEFRDVSFRYREEQPWVLKNCSFKIYENEWVAIIGHNGSGKSTIAKLMNGLLFPQKGEIFINGQQVTNETVWDIRQDVGMVFQNPDNQFVGTTVRDDIAFGMENRGFSRERMLRRIDETLEAVGMTDYLLTEPHRLSGGQKQRVAIASVLAVSPQVIILDEATSMLDPKGRQEIIETVSDVRKTHKLSLITITHDLNEIIEADRVIVMNKGELFLESIPREIFTKRDDLLAIGLDIPFIGQLTEKLEQIGVELMINPLNHEEMMEALWTLHSKT